MTMLEVAKMVLNESTNVGTNDEWLKIDAYHKLLERVYSHDVWDQNFRNCIQETLAKDINKLSMNEVYTHLTTIYAHDRICEGYIEKNINDGTIHKLMRRIVELEEGPNNDKTQG